MSSELDLLSQENAKLVAENAELKHENSKSKQIIEDNAEFKGQNHETGTNLTSQLSSPPPIEDHSDKKYSVSVNQLKTEPISPENRWSMNS
ncbi:11340_t:CDS:2 [Paraglomus brasilianum]|uniref:11340_t:CDS:1 n=1 Tax=Paraglomus brasilianum TaxID=144538 RepID=A0A9N9BWC2_9GLOM|nr:11340_t:CDS:2 [Paraglomus brasilianum]